MPTRTRSLVGITSLLLVAGCPGRAPPRDASAHDASADASIEIDAPEDIAPSDVGPTVRPCTRSPRREVVGTPYTPTQAIEVRRDNLGIPHIYGQTDEDTLFGSGYLQAVDRLFQMEILRRTAYGTTAEIFGRDRLSTDRLLRMVDIARWGRESSQRSQRETPESYALVQAWVSGVNRRIREVSAAGAERPTGFRATEFHFLPRAWTTDDAFAVARLVMFRNANQLEFDILASIVTKYIEVVDSNLPLFASLTNTFVLPADERPRLAPSMLRAPTPRPPQALPSSETLRARFAEFATTMASIRSGGSNNWAVAGRFTDNNRPLIAGDPHQPLNSPPVVWAHHLSTVGPSAAPLDVIGFAFVGTPGVQLGHNRRVAWTATTTYPDMMDLFEVRTNTANATITLGNRDAPVERCVETIAIAGQAPEMYVVEDVPGEGVLLPSNFAPLPLTEGTRNRVLFRWSGFRATIEADVFLGFDRARNVGEFESHVDRMESGAFNFISADARDISYRVHVTMPDRGRPSELPHTPNRILPGSNERAVWPMDRLLPTALFPHSRGESQGFLASANNDPYGFTQDGRTDTDPFYYGVWFDPGTRALRISQELTRLTTRAAGGGARVTADEMQRLQLDTHSVLADTFVPMLEQALTQRSTDNSLAEFRGDAALDTCASVITTWDRSARRGSSGAVAFEGFAHFLAKRVLADDFGLIFDAIYGGDTVTMFKFVALALDGRFASAGRLAQEGKSRLLLLALRDTREWLSTRFGGVEASRYQWQDLHRTTFRPLFASLSDFDGGEYATDGSIGTVNVSAATLLNSMGLPGTQMLHRAGSGAVYRMVASFLPDGTPQATIAFARGNAGDPRSPHYADRVEDWVAGRYQPLHFTRADVTANTTETLTVAP
ncbi:MAG: penicillin acylase family protein [Deltaproteobacteria bacterium]|nr:penicillin acylase family protein [Deltaproteobacteria bacterium]